MGNYVNVKKTIKTGFIEMEFSISLGVDGDNPEVVRHNVPIAFAEALKMVDDAAGSWMAAHPALIAPSSTAVTQAAPDVERFQLRVTEFSYEPNKGKPLLKVHGGKYEKFGIPWYSEYWGDAPVGLAEYVVKHGHIKPNRKYNAVIEKTGTKMKVLSIEEVG